MKEGDRNVFYSYSYILIIGIYFSRILVSNFIILGVEYIFIEKVVILLIDLILRKYFSVFYLFLTKMLFYVILLCIIFWKSYNYEDS